jgi:hypothetical protein
VELEALDHGHQVEVATFGPAATEHRSGMPDAHAEGMAGGAAQVNATSMLDRRSG